MKPKAHLALMTFTTKGARIMTDAGVTRIAGENSDATRFAGEAYRTQMAFSTPSDDKTCLTNKRGVL